MLRRGSTGWYVTECNQTHTLAPVLVYESLREHARPIERDVFFCVLRFVKWPKYHT